MRIHGTHAHNLHNSSRLFAELCDAGSLGAAIRQGMFRPKPGVRTPALARRVLLRTATELCRGMVHIHTANVLHGKQLRKGARVADRHSL